jgi:hypothetical protein
MTLAAGDFNKDGSPDLAVNNSAAATTTVLLSAVPKRLVVAGPTQTVAGKAFSITVRAVNAAGTTLTGYTGTVHFTSNDPGATLPADYGFVAADHGVHTFTGVILTRTGTRFLTAKDTVTGTIAGSWDVKVNPAAATHLRLTAPASVTAGTGFTLTVTALDAFGNVATGYKGTVTFTSTDSSATLPADYTFLATDHGKHSFTVTLGTPGTWTITAKDTTTATITGSATVKANAAHANRRSGLDSGLDPTLVDAAFAAGVA